MKTPSLLFLIWNLVSVAVAAPEIPSGVEAKPKPFMEKLKQNQLDGNVLKKRGIKMSRELKNHKKETQGYKFKVPLDVPICNEIEYDEKGMIGHGLDGFVYKVVHNPTGRIYALKRSKPNPAEIASLQKEIHILSKLKETGITSKIHCSDSKGKYFIMEFLDGVTLKHEIEFPTFDINDSNKRFLYFAQKMTNIYIKMHDLDIIHEDGHIANWIFNPKTKDLHLIDFGRGRDLKPSASIYQESKSLGKKDDINRAGLVWGSMNLMMKEKISYNETWKYMVAKDWGKVFKGLLSKKY